MMPAEKLFDGYAESYQTLFNEHSLGIYQRAVMHEEMRPFLEKSDHVLDIGCGPGSDFELYSHFDIKIDAIDVSEKMADLARRRADELRLDARIIQSSLEEFFPARKYDFIILNFGVINVFGNLTDILTRLSYMLNKNGSLMIVSMPPFHLFTMLELLIRFKFGLIFRRLIRRRLVISATEIYYHGAKPFHVNFRVIRRIHLCSILPSPEQYSRHRVFRKLTDWLISTDKKIRFYVPGFFGGDHVCYILTHRSHGNASTADVQTKTDMTIVNNEGDLWRTGP
ncbi:MAG: class I SAM-dependent methyltransferase [Calditrichaceae bacterium]